MKEYLTGARLQAHIQTVSNKTLVQYETRLGNRLAGLQKCVPWPAVISLAAADLEIIWAEMRQREHAAAHRKNIEDAIFLADKLTEQAKTQDTFLGVPIICSSNKFHDPSDDKR
jgi:hypothetical protein